MFHATRTSIADKAASGIRLAYGASRSISSSNVTECTIPDRGVRPPHFTLAAVRAITPVAGIPPKIIEAILAIPCATSSQLLLCRPPIIPSATTAQRSDSTEHNNAMVVASGTSVTALDHAAE